MYLNKIYPNTVLIPVAMRARLDELSIVSFSCMYNNDVAMYNLLGVDETSEEDMELSVQDRLINLADRQGLPMILIPDRLSQCILIFKFEVIPDVKDIHQIVGLSIYNAVNNRCALNIEDSFEGEAALKYWFDNMKDNIRLGKVHSLKTFMD